MPTGGALLKKTDCLDSFSVSNIWAWIPFKLSAVKWCSHVPHIGITGRIIDEFIKISDKSNIWGFLSLSIKQHHDAIASLMI
jgi:hypothetical protein